MELLQFEVAGPYPSCPAEKSAEKGADKGREDDANKRKTSPVH
jgi:hypothetical protein